MNETRDRLRFVDFGGFWLPAAAEALAGVAWLASMRTVAIATLAAGAAWQIAVLVRSRGTRSFLFHFIACTMLAGLAAGAAGGPRAATLLLPAALACLLVGLGVAHRAAVRDFAARALRRRRADPEEPHTTWLRDRAAIALSIPTVLLALLLAPVATWRFPTPDPTASPPPPETNFGGNGADATVQPPPPDRARPPLPPADKIPFPPAAHGTDAPDDEETGQSGASRPPARRRNSWKDRVVVMRVRPSRDGKNLDDVGPLYLRGLPVRQTGVRWQVDVPPTRTIGDADDGRDDGWCELTVRPAAAERVDLAVHQELPVSAPDGSLVVHSPPGTAAVALPRVRVEPGGVVLAHGQGRDATFDYQLCALTPSRVPFPGQIARVVGRESAALQPAASDAAAARLGAMAQAAVANVSSPVDRVRAVVQHLRDHFSYDDAGASMDDPAALPKLLAARSGSCTQFAEAGVVMLRAIGIPARVGTGFLATEWRPSEHEYVVRARDSHAWVEVAFEDCGWVIFDPTPREPPGAEDGRPEPDAAGPSSSDPPADPEDVTPPNREGDGLEEVVGGVRSTEDTIFGWIRANPLLCAAVAIAALVLGVRAMRRRERRLAGVPVEDPPVRRPWERLVAELARRGHRRRPSQTASEFAASVVGSAGDEYAPLLALTERHEAARFGARPLTPDDDDAIENFRSALRRAAPPSA